MSDALVKVLNGFGYQPVFLPHTGYVPPELYSFAEHKLIRHGALSAYMNKPTTFQIASGELAAIAGKVTSGKGFDAAVGFLTKALAAIGLTAAPKLDLSFAGSKEFSFAFEGVTYEAVDPAELEPILTGLKFPDAISDEDIEQGNLHIAYEYAYATTVTLTRADGNKFAIDISGDIGTYVNVGTNINVGLDKNMTMTFTSTDPNQKAAFAYKAGRIEKEGTRIIFEPEVVKKAALDIEARKRKAEPPTIMRYVPAKGVVLTVEKARELVAA